MLRSPQEEKQRKCLQGLQILFDHAPYDKNMNEGVKALRGKVAVYDADNDNPEKFLAEIVKIAKAAAGTKFKDVGSFFGEEKKRELAKAKALINLIAEINWRDPQHFVAPDVNIGGAVYHIHKPAPQAMPEETQEDASEVVVEELDSFEEQNPAAKNKERSGSDVSPRSQPPLKRQGSGVNVAASKFHYSHVDKDAYDIMKDLRDEFKKGNYSEKLPEAEFKSRMYDAIKALAEAAAQGKSIGKLRESLPSEQAVIKLLTTFEKDRYAVKDKYHELLDLIKHARAFLDTYYVTYVAGRQKSDPQKYIDAFMLDGILGNKGKDVSIEQLSQVQDACFNLYRRYLRVNESVTQQRVEEKKASLAMKRNK